MPQPLKIYPDKICKHCKKPFNRKKFPSGWEDSGRYLKREYCSQSCANSKSEPTDRTTYHLRAGIFLEDFCEACGTKENLEVHHINGDIQENTKENTMTLCHPCHMKLHWKLRKRGIVYLTYKMQFGQIESKDLKHSETPSCHK